jgi:hypothetical protein
MTIDSYEECFMVMWVENEQTKFCNVHANNDAISYLQQEEAY